MIRTFVVAGLLLATPLPAAEFDLFGRITVDKDGKCSICVGCDYVSGSAARALDCGENRILSGGKYRATIVSSIVSSKSPKKSGGECTLALKGEPTLLPPEQALPVYPDAKDLARRLDCSE